MTKEAELQKKYFEIQKKEQQIKQSQEQLANIANHIQELQKIETTLDEIEKTKSGTELLVPLGSGIFAKANLKDNKNLLVGVGAKVHVSKNLDETKKIINKQLKNMEDLALEVEHKLHETSLEVQNFQTEIMKTMGNKE